MHLSGQQHAPTVFPPQGSIPGTIPVVSTWKGRSSGSSEAPENIGMIDIAADWGGGGVGGRKKVSSQREQAASVV